jgi:hypothetical protein
MTPFHHVEHTKKRKEKVEALVNEAIELLEANYDMDNARLNNPAYMTMMDLNSALMELDCLDDEDLKTED